jgi:hypothetical protein
MARGEASVLVRVSTRGAGRTGRRMSAAGREIQRELASEMRELGKAATEVLQHHAPVGRSSGQGATTRKGGRLKRGIHAVAHFSHARLAIEVESDAPYTRVTRFGHRRLTVYPHGGSLAIPFKKVSKRGRRLRKNRRGLSHFDYVEAYHPDFDWVDEATPELEAEAEITIGRIERAIDTKILRP